MSADERVAVLRDAVEAFDEGAAVGRMQPDRAVASFRAAAEGFEALVADGVVNGRLLYNLGNSYLQLGDIGKAILNYRRAERVMGGDPQLRHNLNYARSLRRNQIEDTGERAALHTVFFWHYETSVASRYAAAVGGYVLFWSLLLARGWVKVASLRLAIAACGVLWLAAGTSVAIETAQSESIKEGVTTSSDIVVRKGNGEGYAPQFAESLHEGVEFRVIDERGGWFKIELPDGHSGWIRQAQAEII